MKAAMFYSFLIGSFVIASVAHADDSSIFVEPDHPERVYAVVCKGSDGKTFSEAYALHEAVYQNALPPLKSDPALDYQAILKNALERMRPRSGAYISEFLKQIDQLQDKLRFVSGIDLPQDPNETFPFPLLKQCQTKKLVTSHFDNRKERYLVDQDTWNSLSEVDKATAILDLTIQLQSHNLELSHFLPKNDEILRRFVGLVFWERLDKISDKEWFGILSDLGVEQVTTHGLSVGVQNVTFYGDTFSLKTALASGSMVTQRGEISVKGQAEFFPNGNVHRVFSAGYSSISVPGGETYLTNKVVEFYSDGALFSADLDHRTILKTDHWLLRPNGPASFYSSGGFKSVRGDGLIEISGQVAEIRSGEFPIELDEAGSVITAYLVKAIRATDCHGTAKSYSAGSFIHLNSAGVPCEEKIK